MMRSGGTELGVGVNTRRKMSVVSSSFPIILNEASASIRQPLPVLACLMWTQ
jgi:hypothetical protein